MAALQVCEASSALLTPNHQETVPSSSVRCQLLEPLCCISFEHIYSLAYMEEVQDMSLTQSYWDRDDRITSQQTQQRALRMS
jgi:hypothetical protein